MNTNQQQLKRRILYPGWALTLLFLLQLYTPVKLFAQTANIMVHDPVMIKADSTYYLFCTGWGISVMRSADMVHWERLKPVFDAPPAWALDAVPGFKGHIWAPDISYHDGQYYLYYSVSAFAKNTSCIGLATNKSLDPENPDFKWTDHGKVIQSVPGRDMWNAIDPNLAMDENATPWLTFGSFWNGIKLVKLSDNLSEVAEPETWYTIASRERSYDLPDTDPGDAAIEAPFIFKKNGIYYLFVSWDYCCRGLKSNYKVVVGKSDKITGPFLDKEGKDMRFGGGSLVIEGNEKFAGIGHNSIYTFGNKDYFVVHAYDNQDEGKPKLLIKLVEWDEEGWPVLDKTIK